MMAPLAAPIFAAPPDTSAGTDASAPHTPVLVEAVLDALAPRDAGLYVDATFGAGGYTAALRARAACQVIAFDRDRTAIEAGRRRFAGDDGIRLIEAPFSALDTHVAPASAAGIAFDLGVSSMQIDDPGRGFSFAQDGPLDMRMDANGAGETAADIVNTWPEADLAGALKTYGDERRARAVARAIARRRGEAPFERTGDLAALVRAVVGRSADGIDPATRTFQALRILVNAELEELDAGLVAAERVLAPGGRLAVVSFHSLEDRCVKRFLQRRAGKGGGVSRHQPAPAEAPRAPSLRLITTKPITPGEAEVSANPRARSAKLRVGERTEAPVWPRETAEARP